MTDTARATTADTTQKPGATVSLNFSDWFYASVEKTLIDVYMDAGVEMPDEFDVIDHALRLLAQDARDRADDLASCNHVDDCTATAKVLHALANSFDEYDPRPARRR